MKVVPDVIPTLSLELDIRMSFNDRGVASGDFADSALTQTPPKLSLQSFKAGSRLISIAVIDPDVPNLETDHFESRCHFLALNIPISATAPHVDLAKLSSSQVILPWLPPHALKGSPYHRLSLVILEHKDNTPIAAADFGEVTRENFTVRRALARKPLRAVGAALFRTKWDENMAAVMARHGFEGATIELKRKKVLPLPYKRRNPTSFR
jgi:large subunit ribosomal protein L35